MVRLPVPQTVEQLRTLLQRVREEGATVELLEGSQVVAEMRPPESSAQQRKIGLAKDLFSVPKSFFEPLPGNVSNRFRGK